MTESNNHRIGLIVGIVVVLLLVVGAVFFSLHHHHDLVCERVTIIITDTYHLGLIDEQNLCTYLKQKGLYPQDKVYSNINCYAIETALCDVEVMIRSVECYKTTDGEVVIHIWSREPVMEVISETARYFVDGDRRIVPYRFTDGIEFMRVRGKVDDDFASGQLFDFVQWINTDKYWRHKISNIKVLSDRKVEFYLKALPAKVLLGDLERYEPRMRKLQTLLVERDTMELYNYSEMDLRYKAQVICRK